MKKDAVILFTDFLTNTGGGCYDLIMMQDWGYKHIKVYSPTTDLEVIKQELAKYNLPTEFQFVPEVDENKTDSVISDFVVQQSYSSEELMQQLYRIEKLGIKDVKGQQNDQHKVSYFFSYMIYETNNMAVKIPVRTLSNTDDVKWSFVYLIYPNFTVNTEELNKIRKIAEDETIELNIEGLSANRINRNQYRLFSMYLYNQLQREFTRMNNEAKGIVNAVRVMEHHKVVDSTTFEIMQNSRMVKKDNIAYQGFKYIGYKTLEVELKFKEYLEILGLDISTISNISKNPAEFQKFIDEHEDDSLYEPVLLYMKNLANPYDAMDTYHIIENERLYVKRLKYQLNMVLYDSLYMVQSYILFAQPYLYEDYKDVELLPATGMKWARGNVYEGFAYKDYKPRTTKVRGF